MNKDKNRKIVTHKLNRWAAIKMRLADLFGSEAHLAFKFKKNGQLKVIWFNAHCWLMSILILLFFGLGWFLGHTAIKLYSDSLANPVIEEPSFWPPIILAVISIIIGLVVANNLANYLQAQFNQIGFLANHPEDYKQLQQEIVKIAEIKQKGAIKRQNKGVNEGKKHDK